jgi:hypothetical protein
MVRLNLLAGWDARRQESREKEERDEEDEEEVEVAQ